MPKELVPVGSAGDVEDHEMSTDLKLPARINIGHDRLDEEDHDSHAG